jgi:opacity protein-like surface antigen
VNTNPLRLQRARSDVNVCFLLFVLITSPCCLRELSAQAKPSARDILQHFYRAAGGDAWQHLEECDSRGTINVSQKSGTIRYVENLQSGANRSDVEISALDIKNADGSDPMQNWHQDAAGDVQLFDSTDPDSIDDRYLTRRGYWQPNYGGAVVTVIASKKEGTTRWDRLRFEVPGGRGFTLWINRETGLLDRVERKTTTELSDYRPVNGVLLPFVEKKPAGNDTLTVVYTTRTLREHLDAAAFAIPFRKDYQVPPSGVVITPAEGGLIFQAMINGKGPYKGVFDTGAVNFMSASFVRRLGLKLDEQSLELGTSSPATTQAYKTHVDTLQIGDLTMRDQTFYVADVPDDDAPSFLVGYELLRRFAVRIDFEHQRLTFYDGQHFRYSGPGTAVPLQFDGNQLLVEASIGGASGLFQLDSGNESGFMVNTKFTLTHDLVRKLGAHFLAYNGRGVAGPSPQAYLARVNTMRIGALSIPSIIGHFSTDPSDTRQVAGNIGQSILRHFTETFDCMHGKVYFEPTSDSTTSETFNRAGLIFDSFGHGLQVMTVLPGSPGAQAGIQEGDVITAIDGKAPSDEANQPAFLQPPTTQLHLTVQHGTEARQVTLILKNIL